MKKLLFILPCVAVLLASCTKDFLDREPLSQLSPGSSFNSENQLKLYTNSFYQDVLPSNTSLYDETADNIVVGTLSDELKGTRTVPVSGGGWSWAPLRNINFFLQNYQQGNLPDNITNRYVGLARFFRAYFYFNMVTRFGDVPWYSEPIEANDSLLLHIPRDSRMLVIDSVVADLDFAIEHLPENISVEQINKWTALSLKSRVCLYEGTFRKYHAGSTFGEDSKGNALTGWEELLQKSAEASEAIMTAGKYNIHTGDPDWVYQQLFTFASPNASEFILARTFSEDLLVMHNVNYYTVSPSYGKPGLEKKLVNSYLMRDGSRFTDQPGFNTMEFYEEVQDRDPRLSSTIRTPGYTRMGNTQPLPPDLGATTTGYQLIKFVADPSHDKINGSMVPLPVFRYAEVLLNFAEAKAELGTLTQDDIDRSIKLLRDRVGMPNLNMAAANAAPDDYLANQYVNVSGANKGVILEIRRERRVELVMEGFRWNDLMRWKEGHLAALQFYGEYFPGPGSFDLDGDSKTDVELYVDTRPPGAPGVQFLKLGSDITLENGVNGGRVIVNGNIVKQFNEDRDYLYPIPTQEILLNPELEQNPGW